MTENVRVVNQPQVHAWSRTGAQQWEYSTYTCHHSDTEIWDPDDQYSVFNKKRIPH